MKTRTLLAASMLGLTCASPLVLADGTTAGEKVETTAEKTGEFLSDAALTTKVKTALLAEKNLKSLGINVESTDGVVTLSGEVPNEASIEQAEAVTEAVEGVKDVHNKLELKNQQS